jgi:hypothetical protein
VTDLIAVVLAVIFYFAIFCPKIACQAPKPANSLTLKEIELACFPSPVRRHRQESQIEVHDKSSKENRRKENHYKEKVTPTPHEGHFDRSCSQFFPPEKWTKLKGG